MTELPTMYRGCMEPLPRDGLVEQIRQDRRPRSSSLLMTMLFNLMIERQFGVPTVRRRSLFVCGDISNAAQYSKVRDDVHHLGVVEPIGSFRYLYSPLIDDSLGLEGALGGIFETVFRIRNSEDAVRVLSYFDEPGMTTLADLDKPRRQFFANYSLGQRYIPADPFPQLFAELDRLVKHCVYRMDEGLDEAVRQGAEIMIFDCPEGVRIRPVDPKVLKKVSPRRGVMNQKLPIFPMKRSPTLPPLSLAGVTIALDVDETLAKHSERLPLLSQLAQAMGALGSKLIVITRGALLSNSEILQCLKGADIDVEVIQRVGSSKKSGHKKGKEITPPPSDLPSRIVHQMRAQFVTWIVSDDPLVVEIFRATSPPGTAISADQTADLMRLTQLAIEEYSTRISSLLNRIQELKAQGDTLQAAMLMKLVADKKLHGVWPDDLLDEICTTAANNESNENPDSGPISS